MNKSSSPGLRQCVERRDLGGSGECGRGGFEPEVAFGMNRTAGRDGREAVNRCG